VVVDTRHASEFAAGHIPGTINIPLGRSFTTWAGSVLPYDRDFYLIVEDASTAMVEEVVRDLAMIGLDRVAGCFSASVVEQWIADHRAAQGVPEVSPDAAGLAARRRRRGADRRAQRLRVGGGPHPRQPQPAAGPAAGDAGRIPRDRPLVVHCQSGARAAVAIGVLQANGFDDVRHLAAASEQSHATASATSSGVPIRPIGSAATSWASRAASPPVNRSIIAVRITPGHTAFTRMPCAAYPARRCG
jgi:hydroxyacylglutathione hydrolase